MSEHNAVDAQKPEMTEEEKSPDMVEKESDQREEAPPIATESEKIEVATPEAPQAEETKKNDKPDRPEPKKDRKKRSSKEMAQIVAWFAACGRCSFFLTGYRLIYDEDVLATAVSERSKKWLTVPWSHDAARLVHKTYGSRVDINCYHYEGQCKECHRRFTYQANENKDAPGTFRIELKP